MKKSWIIIFLPALLFVVGFSHQGTNKFAEFRKNITYNDANKSYNLDGCPHRVVWTFKETKMVKYLFDRNDDQLEDLVVMVAKKKITGSEKNIGVFLCFDNDFDGFLDEIKLDIRDAAGNQNSADKKVDTTIIVDQEKKAHESLLPMLMLSIGAMSRHLMGSLMMTNSDYRIDMKDIGVFDPQFYFPHKNR